ncbi:MAG: dihydrofolate reductase, partial [Pseudomonadota bacterium]
MIERPTISIISAVARNNVIGHEGDMPWHVPSDLKRFKSLTLGKPMVMGRKTFESIGSALPGRTSIVVTRQPDWKPAKPDPNVWTAPTLGAAMEMAQSAPGGDDEICIVGGGNIYAQAMTMADVLHISWVQAEPAGDTYFPEIEDSTWVADSLETASTASAPAATHVLIVEYITSLPSFSNVELPPSG